MYIYEENTENFGQERIMMLGGLDYSCTTNENLQYVTVVVAYVVVACGLRLDPFLYATWHSVIWKC